MAAFAANTGPCITFVVERGTDRVTRSAFTLLLSPDMVDFARPVVVIVNGRPVHDALVTPGVSTLLTPRMWSL